VGPTPGDLDLCGNQISVMRFVFVIALALMPEDERERGFLERADFPGFRQALCTWALIRLMTGLVPTVPISNRFHGLSRIE
jgi:hypothetical protein